MRPVSNTVQAVPNVTPMIDVMLVLLVIFMVVAPAMLAGIPATPPVAEHSVARPENPEDQVLGISSTGELFMNKREIAPGSLAATLTSLYSARSEDRVLYVRADRNVDYGVVLNAMDVASKSGVAVVGMITERPLAKAGMGRP